MRRKVFYLLGMMGMGFFLFLWMDIFPKIQLYETLKKVSVPVTTIEQPQLSQVKKIPIVEQDVMHFLMELIEQQGFFLQVLQPKLTIFNVTMTGPFVHFMEFCLQLQKYKSPIVLNDFSIEMDAWGEAKIILDLQVLPWSVYPEQAHIFQREDEWTVSLTELRWVGYVKRGADFLGLVKLPNGETRSIAKNTLIGIEKGCVSDIDENQISINVSGEHRSIH